MNVKKKILLIFALLLVFLFLYCMNFIRLQDLGDEKKEVSTLNLPYPYFSFKKIETDLKEYDDLTKNHENFTKKFENLDKNSTFFPNFSNSLLSLINNSFSFIGEWNSNNRNRVFSYFSSFR